MKARDNHRERRETTQENYLGSLYNPRLDQPPCTFKEFFSLKPHKITISPTHKSETSLPHTRGLLQ